MRHKKNKIAKQNQPRLKPVTRILKASLVGLGLAHSTTQAATLLVTSNADNGSGGCTLREALDSVNTGAAQGGCMDIVPPLNNFGFQDTVLIPGTTFPNNTITLNGSELSVTNPVTVNGFEGLVIDGNLQSPVFNVDDAALILNNTTISRGLGGIRGTYSDIRIINSTISENVRTGGSALEDRGGGVYLNRGSLTLENSSVTNNTSSSFGGGISAFSAVSTISDSTISNNEAAFGGGLESNYGSLYN